jgi:hypothetical protein
VQRDLSQLFPAASEFHARTDRSQWEHFSSSQYSGVVRFPFRIPSLSLLALNENILTLARAMLGTTEVRLYRAEAWAKYAGALEYEQLHHRDFRSHTPLVPSRDWRFRGLEIFIWLHNVSETEAPTHVAPLSASRGLPVDQWGFTPQEYPDLYGSEISAAGPAGTVLAFSTDTVHRATEFSSRSGARFNLHLCFHDAGNLWFSRCAWANRSFDPDLTPPAWERLVEQASMKQLLFLGFPPPGHPFWTRETLHGMSARYPNLDLAPWSVR